MLNRFCFGALLLACLALTFTGCTTSGLDSIQVTPATASLVVGGATLQLTAMGTFGNGAHPTRQEITSQVTWTSTITGVATVSSSGVVTAVSAGTTNITASAQGFNGPLSASATITVTGAGAGNSSSGPATTRNCCAMGWKSFMRGPVLKSPSSYSNSRPGPLCRPISP